MSGLGALAGGAERFVIVDTETTGVYPSDRIVEIAIITMDLDGQIVDVYDTLINPMRDVSASHIHGVTASMVVGAPTFAEIAGDIALRLDGACFVAHNVPFDRRMLVNEYAAINAELTIPRGVDTLTATGFRLADACAFYDIDLTGAHRALNDAMATAQLLRVLRDADAGTALAAPVALQRSGKIRRREDAGRVTLPDTPLVAFLASRLPHTGMEVRSIEYLELLGRALDDLHFDAAERREVAAFAVELGLSEAQIQQAHRRFVHDLIDAALVDEVITDDEYDAVVRVAAALGVDEKETGVRLHPWRAHATSVKVTAGMRVVFTGDHPHYDRSQAEADAHAMGLIVGAKTVTKDTSLVIAADPNSTSGKALKARRYGIPVIAMDDFHGVAIGSVVQATGAPAELKVITCRDCHATWTVPAVVTANTTKRCSQCATLAAERSPAPPRPKQIKATIVDVWAPPSIEWLTCRRCQTVWHRQVLRGRKPHYCPPCSNDAPATPPPPPTSVPL